ncbi:MAG: hypothetical protein DI538_27865 [Azospira oryzae]|jgi:RNA polymerase sigma-70 factor (ECF subfamily)|nr:MAG: hypothetical protein DI538_27865 [Azospira oryzae]
MIEGSDVDDNLILQLMKTNESEAHALMFKCHYDAVLNYILKITGNKDQSKDIVQGLFVVIWEKRAILNIRPPVRAYLFSAAHRRMLNHIRDQNRRTDLNYDYSETFTKNNAPPTPDLLAEGEDLDGIIRLSVSFMPPRVAATFSANRSIPYKELSTHLNISKKAIEKNMKQAMSIVRLVLNHYKIDTW